MTNPATAAAASNHLRGDWIADQTACTITFAVRNFALRTVTGHIPLTRATVTVDASGQPTSIHAELDAQRIDTRNPRRDHDLRSPRFLATDAWPTITFEAGDIHANTAGWTVDGTLTVKDTHCPLRLDVAAPNPPPGDPAAPVDLCATGQLDRRAAGITAAPAFLIGHKISLHVIVQLRHRNTRLQRPEPATP
jgi:polyisoprenoid-binding protein YceI